MPLMAIVVVKIKLTSAPTYAPYDKIKFFGT